MIDFETSKKQIASLVEEFKTNEHIYKTVAFDEENTKINFINKFFQALGWDVTNEAGVAPQFKDVEFEDTVLVGGKPKAPDYCFRIGGARIFFVEAKKPSVDIEHDRRYAFQLKRYTWSAHLPLGLLTDFEELAIYEPKTAPKKTHNTSVDRIKYYHYSEYVDNWEEIYNIYSKEAVLTGKFDQYVKNIHGDKKGTSTVDSEFLKTIEEWRLELAKNIALRNKELTVDELNFAVQLIIDRIIFLRIAEDRGIERYGQLKKLTELARNEKDNYPVYDAFIELCRKADAKYNSGLFHFTEEKDISLSADTLTPGLHVDDGKLKKIIDGLYYPDCPYEFSMISTEILGNIYEQFLGKVIRLTEGHQAKVEDKPEVKKAGGVFYTPQYIVNYIVENTVGELLKGKTPNKVSELRIVDPACGSGSFLLGAYQKLLDWHVDYYSNLEQPPKNVIYTGKDGIPRLTIQEKKRILLNNIYGVDIDSQAVEVTKLSLLLKVLEDENKDVLEAQQKLIQERALPYLGDNIRCGNSLIAIDIFEYEDIAHDEMLKINPFDWKDAFSDIFSNGGFDAVIGNPPYLRIQGLREFFNNQIPYLKDHYDSAVKRFDLYVLFLEKGSSILNDKGILGYICPNKFINADFGSGIRKFLIEHNSLKKFISFDKEQIFENATTYTSLVFLSSNNKTFDYYEYNDDYISPKEFLNNIELIQSSKYDISKLDNNAWKLLPQNIKKILDSMENNSVKLGEIFENIFQGIVTGIDDIYFLNIVEEHDNIVKAYSTKLEDYIEIEKNILKPILKGEDVTRYSEPTPQYYCIYPYLNIEGKTKIMEEDYLKSNYPLAYSYLKEFKSELVKLRKKFKTNVKYWYSCHRPRNMALFEMDKILTPEISFGCNMTFSNTSFFHNTKVYSLVIPENVKEDKFYWLGLFNSKLLWWFISNTGYVLRGGYFSFSTKYLKEFPIPVLNWDDKMHVEIHDKISTIAKDQLELYASLNNSKVPNEINFLKKKIEFNDDTINKLVYELYNLTDEEIVIIDNENNL